MIGKILGGRYELLEEIGKGGMAHVYRARCVLLNRIVAVKVLRDDLDGDDEFLERFNAEAQAAASLTHPNIVSIFDVGVDDDCHYIIMEYVDGKTLKEYISEKGKLDYKEALDIASQICDALNAAHTKNIVHRDIKPHNILITKNGQIKVADFGIARFGTGNTVSSNDKDILGSVHYISPEQAKGITVDNRGDIYSLGVVLYEMLSGNLPFEGDNPVSIAMKQIEETPKDITDEFSDIPLSSQHIVFKAMSKDPDLRYQSAYEMKSDIIKVCENPDVIIDKRFLYDNFNAVHTGKDIPTPKKNIVTKKSVKILMISCAAITSLFLVFIGYIAVNNNAMQTVSSAFSSKEDVVKIPNVKGMKVDEATKICRDLGLKLIVEDEIEDDKVDPETVISQNPEKNLTVKKGETVKVVVSKKNDIIEIENFVGMDFDEVQNKFEDLSLTVNIIFEESQKSKNTVIRQSPEFGKKLNPGGRVTLYVSGGMDMNKSFISVPTITGKTYSDAKRLLESVGLKMGSSNGTLNPLPDDMIISQMIPAGSMVKKGCEVSVTVEKKEKNIDALTDDTLNTESSDTEKTNDKDDLIRSEDKIQ